MTEKQRRAVAHICGEDVLENVRIAASLPRVNQVCCRATCFLIPVILHVEKGMCHALLTWQECNNATPPVEQLVPSKPATEVCCTVVICTRATLVQGRKRQENLVAKMLRNQLDDAAVAKLAVRVNTHP
jgi:hypothetical protein